MTETSKRYKITAYSPNAKRRVHIFTWAGNPQDGVQSAQHEADERGIANLFEDFRAEECSE